VRRKILGRRACFSRARFHEVYYPHLGPLTAAQRIARPDVWHPIARRHPHTGWTSLYIGRWAYKVDGMADDEAQELIDYLKDFAIRPEFVYRHPWRIGDALLWDNRCVQHCATPFDDSKYHRLMHRTTLEGETPIMADRAEFRPRSAGNRRTMP
jgi:taurine dioxygenase/putative 2-oxoglutarate oxygenase